MNKNVFSLVVVAVFVSLFVSTVYLFHPPVPSRQSEVPTEVPEYQLLNDVDTAWALEAETGIQCGIIFDVKGCIAFLNRIKAVPDLVIRTQQLRNQGVFILATQCTVGVGFLTAHSVCIPPSATDDEIRAMLQME